MNSSNSIAVIGTKAIVKFFQVLGYDYFAETTPAAIIDRCETLTAAGYQIIFILDTAAQQIDAYLQQHVDRTYPLLIPLPDGISATDYGLTNLQRTKEQAYGMKTGGN